MLTIEEMQEIAQGRAFVTTRVVNGLMDAATLAVNFDLARQSFVDMAGAAFDAAGGILEDNEVQCFNEIAKKEAEEAARQAQDASKP